MKFSDILVIILVIIVLLLVGGGVYYFFFTDNPLLSNEDAYTPLDPEEVASSTTKSFSGDKCKVSLSHPTNWQASETVNGEIGTITVSKGVYSVAIACNAVSMEVPVWNSYLSEEIQIDGKNYTRVILFEKIQNQYPLLAVVYDPTAVNPNGDTDTGETPISTEEALRLAKERLEGGNTNDNTDEDNSDDAVTGSRDSDIYVLFKDEKSYAITYSFPTDFDNRTLKGQDEYDLYMEAMDEISKSIKFDE